MWLYKKYTLGEPILRHVLSSLREVLSIFVMNKEKLTFVQSDLSTHDDVITAFKRDVHTE